MSIVISQLNDWAAEHKSNAPASAARASKRARVTSDVGSFSSVPSTGADRNMSDDEPATVGMLREFFAAMQQSLH